MILLGLSRSTIFELESIKDEDGNLILSNENMSEAEALQWVKDNIKMIEEGDLLPKLLIAEINDMLKSYSL